jgi:RimJ/RimL family protein N-acetyltransferase
MIGFSADVKSEMKLMPLSRDDAEQIREWRLDFPETLRTSLMLNYDQQQDWYTREIEDRNSKTRYWALYIHDTLVGYGGIENISWENRSGEISVLIAKQYHGRGYGRAAVGLFIDHAFGALNLDIVYGEVYTCGNVEFWKKICAERGAETSTIPARKFWKGKYYDSMFFVFRRKQLV